MRSLLLVLLVLLVLLCGMVRAGEREEVERLAPKYQAKTEVRLWDRARIDMLTETEAIEVDWAHKWAEGIGQSLYYSTVTGKKPALLLLYKDLKASAFHIYRAQTVCTQVGIKLYLEKVKE